MKQKLKYILLIIIVFSFGNMFSQSLITAKFTQVDSICDGTKGIVKIAMYDIDSIHRQKVSHYRLMFEYDADLMEIKDITTKHASLENFDISYPVAGQCVILDTLTAPFNFYVKNSEETALLFEISLTGRGIGQGNFHFINDSCYFKTEEDEIIASICSDTLDINVHRGFISMFPRQTAKGCSYENKGQAEVTVYDGTPPYKYIWSEEIPFFSTEPHRIGQLFGGELGLIIIDGNGCRYDTTLIIETNPAPNIELSWEPEVIVIEKPIRFEAKDMASSQDKDDYVMSWKWELYYTDASKTSTDTINLWEKFKEEWRNQTAIEYVFLEEGDYEIWLTATGQKHRCDTTIIEQIKVEIAEPTVKNLVTPGNNRFKISFNGDQKIRDVFVSHTLIIQDRTGRKVYETKDFPDDGWDGGGCPNGTYYYILKAKSTRKEYKYQGVLVILGGNG